MLGRSTYSIIKSVRNNFTFRISDTGLEVWPYKVSKRVSFCEKSEFVGYKPEIFQDELRKYREESRYSYDELAQRSGIPMKTLKRWILTAAPKSPPKRDRLVRLAAALNLTGVVLNHFFDLVAEPIPTVSEIHSEAERELDKDVKQILTMWAAQLDSGDKSSQADDPIAARVLQLPLCHPILLDETQNYGTC